MMFYRASCLLAEPGPLTDEEAVQSVLTLMARDKYTQTIDQYKDPNNFATLRMITREWDDLVGHVCVCPGFFLDSGKPSPAVALPSCLLLSLLCKLVELVTDPVNTAGLTCHL